MKTALCTRHEEHFRDLMPYTNVLTGLVLYVLVLIIRIGLHMLGGAVMQLIPRPPIRPLRACPGVHELVNHVATEVFIFLDLALHWAGRLAVVLFTVLVFMALVRAAVDMTDFRLYGVEATLDGLQVLIGESVHLTLSALVCMTDAARKLGFCANCWWGPSGAEAVIKPFYSST
jgi:hypothetical protein